MAQAANQELVDRFEEFYRRYYSDDVAELARKYPRESKSLHLDWRDLYQMDPDLADDYVNHPDDLREAAEEALRLYDLPVDVSLGQAHVRVFGLDEHTEIRAIRAEHLNTLVSVQGMVRKATDVRPKIERAVFVCQRCGAETEVPQGDAGFQEPYQCESCERQGPFKLDPERSEFVDSQKLRIQESPEGLAGGETPQSIDVHVADDITGEVTPGDHVTVSGVLRLDQSEGSNESPVFDLYMEGTSVVIEDEEFDEMNITEEDKQQIVEISNRENIYEQMVDSMAPSIYGHREAKLAMILQLFSGVTKHLPDESRIRGDLHMLLIGDPGTGKCLDGDTHVTLADGTKRPIRDIVEENLDNPKPVDDGVYDDGDLPVLSMDADGTLTERRATRVWKREAPDQMYRIRTSSGREIEVTPSHPLFVQRDGRIEARTADELDANEFVATPRSLQTNGDDTLDVEYRSSESGNAVRLDLPETWTPSLARLVGYIIAEGYAVLGDDNTGDVRVTNNDDEILDDVTEALDALGLNYAISGPREGKSAKTVRCTSGEFASFLESLEPVILQRSADQRVPDPIRCATAETKREFLRAYVDAEGHVSATQREITVASMSRELLNGVRSLLLAFDVTSSIEARNNGSYRIRISGDSFERYVEQIGFVTERKSTAAVSYDDQSSNTNVDVIPEIGEELRRIRETLELSQFDCSVPRTTYQHYERGDRNPSRDSLRQVVEAFEDRVAWLREAKRSIENGSWEDVSAVRNELNVSQAALASEMDVEQTAVNYYERNDAVPDGGKVTSAKSSLGARIDEALSVETDVKRLRHLVENDVSWDRIESIEPVEPAEEWVYDLEVEGTHAYLSNGVVSHNSALISYVQNIAPRSVYTSGKGSSSAGLTAAAVRDDFGDGQQWTLEAGALVLADQGVAAVDELDKMRCVTGDTLVHFDGRVSRIRDFAVDAAESGDLEELPNGRTIRGVDADVWTMTESGRLEKRPVTAVHEYDAPNELVEVTLASGERLTATHDHPFFIFEDGERVEQPAEELSDDDWVYVPRSLSGAAADGGSVAEASATASDSSGADGVEPEFAAVLGYLAGDGDLYYDRGEGVYGIRFTNKEEQLLADFEDAARSTFDAEPTRPPSEQRDDGVETVRVHGREHADRVLDAGMNRETYDGKTLPGDVTASSRAAKAAFVCALADSEGSVGDRQLRIHSASYELLLGVKHLLLEFGVSSQLHHREHGDNRDIYNLTVTDADSLAAFDRWVGFTLDRKQDALEDAVERVSGERTIRDVVPDVGGRLEAARESLRLHQAECGINDVTYCNFENGDANISIRLARDVLDAFESRQRTADRDRQRVTDADWRTLESLRDRYHVSQDELANGTAFSQQQVSRLWGEDESLLATVRSRLREVVEGVAETDLTTLREVVYGDVKWRRVASVEPVSPDEDDDRIPVLRGELADNLGVPEDETVEAADELLAREPDVDSWSALRTALSRHGIAHEVLAADLGVNQSTVTRWLNEDVETDRFVEAANAALDRIHEVRSEADRLRSEIERREQPKVYDLTVAGTHNFVANGMIVHNSEDRSAMHEALEQQKISISKAGINATLKARCSLLGAANPKYGRFDQYEPIGEQIDLEPALISRFDLIFTVTDEPDPEEDAKLARHILQTNYAGELNTQQEQLASANHTAEEVDAQTDTVAPAIDASLLRKYIAYSRRNCYPTMSDEAREAIEDFYVDLRAEGQGEDAPVPVTARQLEALVRLGEASARVRLSDTVEVEDAERVIEIVRSCLQDIGVDPETGEYDADVVETGRSKTQRDRVKNVKAIIKEIEDEFDEGAPVEEVLDRAEEVGMDASKAEHEIEKLKEKGELYQPNKDHLRAI
ncbi:LAGLIDADG family homing endonuclease [Halobacterium noricense]|uniref:LAGLIDADG family homing endonuclease n=1 Tax=Halobacterium noricense TaxID=223182 RepID=UPI001E3D54EB|nr:LAGLIDADG family homing endonuclease [Halobacterium noricense]UHH25112.1 ATPase [Halobacterium noricense]